MLNADSLIMSNLGKVPSSREIKVEMGAQE